MEYVEIARAVTPRGEVVLRARRADPTGATDAGGEAFDEPVLELRVNGVFVMDTAETSTERELARTALAAVEDPAAVLVGGLGLGFTLHEVLRDPRVRHADVVEIEEPIVRWMRDGTVPHGPSYLADPRSTVIVGDLAPVVQAAAPASYDLVLLDVDNGPGYLVHDRNAAVYEAPFLERVRDVLRPRGAAAVWSASASAQLHRSLAHAFAEVSALPLDVTLQGRAEQYWLYLARG